MAPLGEVALGYSAMTEHGWQYVAEQAWTCVSPAVASRLLEVDSPLWLLPFLRLAGGDGERAGTRVLTTSPALAGLRPPGKEGARLEEVELGDRAPRGSDGSTRRLLLWRTAGFAVLFRRLEGDLSAVPRAPGTVLRLEGCFERPAPLDVLPNGMLAGRRAAETAARSLLGHLRAALEDPAAEEMLA
jgi:hypothetical protein